MYRLHVRNVQSCVSHLSHSLPLCLSPRARLTTVDSVFVFSTIRGQSVTNTIGNHLQTCPNTGSPNWPDVQDQQIPSSLQVNQNVNQGADPELSGSSGSSGSSLGSSDTSSSSSSSGFFSSGATSLDVDWARVYLGVAGVMVVRIGLMAMFDDITDLSLCII